MKANSTVVSWWQRVRQASAAQRLTAADRQSASVVAAELRELAAERDRLTRDGVPGSATIIGIRRDVATTALGTWHELALNVQLAPGHSYRTARRIAVNLTDAPHIAVGAVVAVRVDPLDWSKVLVMLAP